MVKKRSDRCRIEGCGRTVKCAGLCSRCYQGVRYWLNKRSVRAITSRAHDLEVWKARLDAILGDRKVTRIRPRRRRKAA